MASLAVAGYIIWLMYASSIESELIPLLVDNLPWIIPLIILVAGVPHMLRVARSNPWRLLILVGILAVAGAQPILRQRIYEGRLTGRTIDTAYLAAYLSVLALVSLVLFAEGFAFLRLVLRCWLPSGSLHEGFGWRCALGKRYSC